MKDRYPPAINSQSTQPYENSLGGLHFKRHHTHQLDFGSLFFFFAFFFPLRQILQRFYIIFMRYASIYLDTNLLLLSATAPYYLPPRLFLTSPAYPFHFIYLLTNNNEHLLLLLVWSSLSAVNGWTDVGYCFYLIFSTFPACITDCIYYRMSEIEVISVR